MGRNFYEWCIATDNTHIVDEWDKVKNDTAFETLSATDQNKVWWKCLHGHSYDASPYNRCRGRGCPYCANRKIAVGFNDLQTTHPHLLAEWDYEMNTYLPTELVAGSMIKVWWKCRNGHHWAAAVTQRANRQSGCPFCAHKRVQKKKAEAHIKKVGSLLDTHPELLKEWDYSKNIYFTPSEVTRGSNRKVFWKCSKNHSWEATIACRTRGTGCPYCCDRWANRRK